MNMDNLKALRPGVYVNLSDRNLAYKSMRYQALEPSSPIHEASVLVRAGQYQQAKAIYMRLLQHKESLDIHRKLAPLLTYEETTKMLHRYWQYKSLRQIYQTRANSFPQSHSSRGAFAWIPWLLLFMVLALVASLGTFVYHKYIYTVNEQVENTIQQIPHMPSVQFTHRISVSEMSTSGIVHSVDTSSMLTTTPYELDYGNKIIGYATSGGNNNYVIYLLGAAEPKTTSTKTAVTNIDMNTARTAYEYYLETHREVPPTSLATIQGMVPATIPLQSIRYTPSLDPTTALTGSVSPIAFVRPVIYINLKNRTLQLQENGKTVLHAPIGIGNARSPTPTGDFIVTGRIINHLSSVYGKYIFPLNQSHYAIHGTNQPTRIGQAASIGCIELSNQVIQKLYNTIPVGTEVVIQNGSKPQSPTWFK